MTLYEAYIIIQTQKERMQDLLKKPFHLSDEQRRKVTDEVMMMHQWLCDQSKHVTVVFNLTDRQETEGRRV
jgi:hypothetical protein